jgi:Domain of unknown function (DUF4397)
MILKSKLVRLLFVGVASAGLLAACGGSDNDDRLDVNDPNVRFVHAVPDGPNVTLRRSASGQAAADETGATDVPYKYASEYYDVSTEDYTFSLNTGVGGSGTELDTIQFNADRGNRFTIVALPADGGGAELVAIRDPYDKSVTSDDARLRVLNAASNAGAFDVYLTSADADLAAETADLSDIGFKVVKPDSGNNSLDEIEAGTYRLRLTPAGDKSTVFFNAVVTIPEDGDWLLLALPEDAATPNSVRLLLVKGDDSDPTTEELVTE